MKKHIFSILALCFVAQMLWAASVTAPANIPNYYSNINGTSGNSLYGAIHTTAKKGYSSLTYKGLWSAYKTTDVLPSDNNKIWDMYGGCSFTYSKDQCGSYKNECDCYNREHSIPKSWFGSSENQNTPGTDIFHVVPTDGKVNGIRSNYPYGEVSTASYSYNGNKLGTPKSISISKTMLGVNAITVAYVGASNDKVFEPIDEYKGDFARGYFGTLLRWEGDYEEEFTQDFGNRMFSGQHTKDGHWGLTQYGLALLLKWHRDDPVSQKEIDRNNGIQQTQGNRNPFIDYPYLAEYIWGEHAGETVDMSKLMPSTDPEFVPGVSNGFRSQATADNNVTISKPTVTKIIINGQLFIEVNHELYDIMGQKVK